VTSTVASRPEWARRGERGAVILYRFFAWFSLALGRAPARGVLRIATVYFLVFGGGAGRASREFLTRCLGRRPTLAERYRHIFTFASTLHDRLFFLRDRFDLFELEVHGAEHFDERGALLMGSHLGSFEALRAAGRGLAGRRVAMAMFEDNAQKVNGVLMAVAPGMREDIVTLGRLDSMLELEARLHEGALVGVLADRTLEGDAQGSAEHAFLGHPARFPLGPMRMAAALRARVIFMAALYRGGNRYEIRFEPLADFSGTTGARGERDARVREAVRDYVARLEDHARGAPDNWFNFYPFWEA
jgi:predicted LPLAT superfamily acyltransferase